MRYILKSLSQLDYKLTFFSECQCTLIRLCHTMTILIRKIVMIIQPIIADYDE